MSVLVAAAVLVSAFVHGALYFVGMSQTPVIGPLFLLNAAGGLVIALAVLFWRHWLPLVAALGFGVLTLAAFWLSVTVGMFGFHEYAVGVAQIAAEVAEIVAIVGSAVLLVKMARGGASGGARERRPARRASA